MDGDIQYWIGGIVVAIFMVIVCGVIFYASTIIDIPKDDETDGTF